MNKPERRRINPFYILLVIVGMAFVITACAYFVMALKELHAGTALQPLDALEQQAAGSEAFVRFMDQYGMKMMLVELGVLAVATFAAIGTDRFWSD